MSVLRPQFIVYFSYLVAITVLDSNTNRKACCCVRFSDVCYLTLGPITRIRLNIFVFKHP